MNTNLIAMLIGFAALLVSFWVAHSSNVRRIQREAERLARMEERLNMLWGWFERTWGPGGKVNEGHGD